MRNMNQKKTDQTSETIYRCKVDSKRFFTEDELLAHLKEKHSESYSVQRVVEQAEQAEVKTEPVVKKRPYHRKPKVAASTNKESPDEAQTDAIKPQFVQA